MDSLKQLIIPTGYMGSGSSVITDLVSEIDGYTAKQGTFEYMFLHCPDGLFDLEDKLLVGNNAVRSDEALRSFLKRMRQLYDKKYWWVGHYKELIGPEFWPITEAFVSELVDVTSDNYWYYQENVTFRMFWQLVWQKIVRVATLGRYRGKKVLQYQGMQLAYPTAPEFYDAARQYVANVLSLTDLPTHNMIMDQLLLPFNLHRIDDYFGDYARAFVVERDPRDVFVANKYVYAARNEAVPYPTDVTAFCTMYRKLRQMERPAPSDKVCRLRFEDLIYRYDDSLARLYAHLGLPEAQQQSHRRFARFDPQKSIDNTQLFLIPQETIQAERRILERELAPYLYEFPYERMPDQQQAF